MNATTLSRPKLEAVLPYIGFALFVLTAKLIIIYVYGNATPYWDQWDAEADNLYRPLLEGKLTWVDLLAAHNEHRIFTTRLLAILLLKINNGVWNPLLQMQVNAFLHVTSLIILLFYTSKTLSTNQRNVLIVFCATAFAIPFGWENTLAGFQSQFYFLLGFSFLYLWIMATSETYTIKWWLGVIIGILCPLSLASGAISILAGVLILTFRRFVGKEKSEVAITAIVILIAIAMGGILLTPVVPGHAALKAQSVIQFLHALIDIFSWPTNQLWFGFIITHTPLLLLCFRILRNPDYRSPSLLFIASVSFWLLGQFLSIAYGRAADVTASRYLDLFAIGLVINFVALGIIFNNSKPNHKKFIIGYWILWIVVILSGFASSIKELGHDLKFKHDSSLEQEKNVRNYLCSGNIMQLEDKPYLNIPYPNPDRLKSLLDNPIIRSILPGNIYVQNSDTPIISN